MQNLLVVYCGEPPRYRLAHKTDSENDIVEEVVLHAQGILCAKDLPPFQGSHQ